MSNRICLLLLTLTIGLSCFSQDDNYKEPSKESQAYHKQRHRLTTPPYGLEKVKSLAAKVKPVRDDDDVTTTALSPKVYESLSLREKFTYNMTYPESNSQNCDITPTLQDEQKKIFGHLPDVFGEDHWSERQMKFFEKNKDSVMSIMKESIDRSHHVGLNYKWIIVDINAKEMIPFLITTYNSDKNDRDILTVLLLLMEKNKYPEFMKSTSYKKLYASVEENYNNYYTAYLDLNKANEDLIIQRATDFYNGK
ncbi:MAG: hypothetical protein JST68_19285 [Bacteroidetes bacterium]|nr:hypothetical protein [Bacteroidota bacterium]